MFYIFLFLFYFFFLFLNHCSVCSCVLLYCLLCAAFVANKDIYNVVRSCTFHTRSLRHIRPLMTADAAKMIASSIVGAWLDYCNSLLFGTTARNLDRLQRVQNTLAPVVLQQPFSAHSTSTGATLAADYEWMNENARILSAFENRLRAGFV